MCRIIGICTVKNENDVIYECLKYSSSIYDIIFVTDNKSRDGSREEIKRASSDFQNVVYLGEVGDKLSKEVKWQVWETFKPYFGVNDWWGILDADEFVEPGLPEIVQAANREWADHIFGAMANFYYTESEFEDWMEGRETLEDRERSIRERRKFYRMHTTQPRLFRNLPWIRWNEDTNYPPYLSRIASKPAVYRHYQYRDVPQIKLRVETRSRGSVPDDHFEINPHWKRTEWKDAIASDDRPYLKKHEDGTPLEPCETFDGPPDPPNWIKSAAKYFRAFLYGAVTKQRKADLFYDLDPPSVLKDALSDYPTSKMKLEINK